MYQYLLWDIDGTVLDFLASEAHAVRALFQKYRLGACSDDMLRLYSEINVRYWEALERNEMTKPEILVGRFQTFFERIGVDPALAESFNRDYQVALGDHLVFVDHAEEMLRAEKGVYTLIAVTNGTKVAQTKKLRRSGLDRLFDAVFISEEVGCEKPNLAYFEHVFSEAGIADKSRVLLIGDSLTSDMKGGWTAGVDTCWYNPKHSPNRLHIPVTYEIDDLGKLAEILSAAGTPADRPRAVESQWER